MKVKLNIFLFKSRKQDLDFKFLFCFKNVGSWFAVAVIQVVLVMVIAQKVAEQLINQSLVHCTIRIAKSYKVHNNSSLYF
jgi:hypothetical protein